MLSCEHHLIEVECCSSYTRNCSSIRVELTCIPGEVGEGLTGVPGCLGEPPSLTSPVGRLPGLEEVAWESEMIVGHRMTSH